MPKDDPLRLLIRQSADEAPRFEPALEQVRGRARRRRIRRSVGVGLTCLVVMVAIAIPLALLSGLDEAPPPGHPSPAALRGGLVLSSVTPVQRGLVDVASGYGSVWTSGANVLMRIDPTTSRVLARVHLPGAEDYSRIAVGEGSIWISADKGIVYRVDPATDKIVAKIDSGVDAIRPVAVGAGYVWVAGSTYPSATSSTNAHGALKRIDPRIDRPETGTRRVGTGPSDALFAAGWLWLSTTEGVQRIDPMGATTASGILTVPGTSGIRGQLAFADGSVWATLAHSLVRIDPSTAVSTARIGVPGAISVSAGGGAIWVVTSRPASVLRVDPSTNEVVGEAFTIPGRQPTSLAATGDSAWAADYDSGDLTQVGTAASERPLGSRLWAFGPHHGGR
jgi:hypothetical protein